MPGMLEALGSIPGTARKREKVHDNLEIKQGPKRKKNTRHRTGCGGTHPLTPAPRGLGKIISRLKSVGLQTQNKFKAKWSYRKRPCFRNFKHKRVHS